MDLGGGQHFFFVWPKNQTKLSVQAISQKANVLKKGLL